MAVRKQWCFNCGKPLGEFDAWGDHYVSCGERECEKEARYWQQADRDERADNAEKDDYARY